MKKIFFVLAVVAVFALSSCRGNKTCPAYDDIDLIEESDNTLE